MAHAGATRIIPMTRQPSQPATPRRRRPHPKRRRIRPREARPLLRKRRVAKTARAERSETRPTRLEYATSTRSEHPSKGIGGKRSQGPSDDSRSDASVFPESQREIDFGRQPRAIEEVDVSFEVRKSGQRLEVDAFQCRSSFDRGRRFVDRIELERAGWGSIVARMNVPASRTRSTAAQVDVARHRCPRCAPLSAEFPPNRQGTGCWRARRTCTSSAETTRGVEAATHRRPRRVAMGVPLVPGDRPTSSVRGPNNDPAAATHGSRRRS